jgi:hypothetical protein
LVSFIASRKHNLSDCFYATAFFFSFKQKLILTVFLVTLLTLNWWHGGSMMMMIDDRSSGVVCGVWCVMKMKIFIVKKKKKNY